MDEERRKQLIRQRAAAKASLTRFQKYIDSGECKLNQLQIRYDELPVIASKFEVAQSELETFDEQSHETDRAQFEEQYFDVKKKKKNLWNYCTQLMQTIHQVALQVSEAVVQHSQHITIQVMSSCRPLNYHHLMEL